MGSGSPTVVNSGGQTSQNTSQQTNSPASWVQQGGLFTSNVAEQLGYMPYTYGNYVPNWNIAGGWTGGIKNPITGENYTNEQYSQWPGFESFIAPRPDETTAGLNRLTNRATQGSPITNAAQQNLTDTLSGKYLSPDSNPYLSGMYDAASRQMMQKYNEAVVPQVNADFSRAGAFGGSAHELFKAQQARDLQQGLGDMASQMYGNQYEQERQKQLQASLLSPQIAQSDYYDIQALLSAGDINREEAQRLISEKQNYVQSQRQYPYQVLQMLSGTLPATWGAGGGTTYGSGTSFGATSTSQPNPYYVNPASKAMGGLASGIGTGAMLGMATGNPLIGAAGGLAGLLGGLLR